MTLAEITLVAFTLCNSLRVMAYIPQIVRAAKDHSGAEAISFATWGLFLLSNISAIAYALMNVGDWTMAAIFSGNAVGCSAILLIGAHKRSRHRRRSGAEDVDGQPRSDEGARALPLRVRDRDDARRHSLRTNEVSQACSLHTRACRR